MNTILTIPDDMCECSWYEDMNARIMMLHILILAKRAENGHSGCLSLETSYRKIAESAGLTYSKGRMAIRHLAELGEIDILQKEGGTLISVQHPERWMMTQEKASADGIQDCVKVQKQSKEDESLCFNGEDIQEDVDSHQENKNSADEFSFREEEITDNRKTASLSLSCFEREIPEDGRERDFYLLCRMIRNWHVPDDLWQDVIRMSGYGEYAPLILLLSSSIGLFDGREIAERFLERIGGYQSSQRENDLVHPVS